MLTDTERREVARRLRKAIGLTEFAEALGFNWTDDSDWGWKDVSDFVADLIEPDDPPYNLYTLYEAVFHRSPRCWECIEDDEVDELVDALLDICNSPGHECIREACGVVE